MIEPPLTQVMEAPLVSVGIPVYNGGPLLRRALDSIVSMEYPNMEIIISDNASSDLTNDLCSEYAEKDGRITLLRQRHNIGALKNFETVLAHAKGAYFMWAAADDWWDARFIGTLVSELEKHPGAVVAMSAVDRILEDGSFYDSIRLSEAGNPNSLEKKDLLQAIVSPAKLNLFIYGLFRLAQLRAAIPYFPDTLGGDRQFIVQMAFAGSFRYVDEVLHVRTFSRTRHAAYQSKSSLARFRAHQLISFWRMLVLSPLVDWREWRVIWSLVWRYRRLLIYR